jgi:hypothetical protein
MHLGDASHGETTALHRLAGELMTQSALAKRNMTPDAAKRYQHAALAYLVYGVIYMAGAGHLGMTGATSRASESGAWVWYMTGAVFVLVFPFLISRGLMWFTRVLALLVCFRVYGLLTVAAGPTAGEDLQLIGDLTVTKSLGAITFAAVALVTVFFLARASFFSGTGPAAAEEPTGTAS